MISPADEAALLDASATTPQDPTARLVYADWLDERDRPLDGALQRVLAEPERDDHRLAYAVVCAAEADRLERVSPPSESDIRQPATMLRARVVRSQVELAGIIPPRKLHPILIEFLPPRSFAAGIRRSGVLVSQHGRAVLRRTEELVPTLPTEGDVIDLVGSDSEGAYGHHQELLGVVVTGVNHNAQRAEIEVTFSRREDHFAERGHRRWIQDMAFHALAFNGLYWVPELAPEQEHFEGVPEDGRFDVLHIDGIHASARFVRGFVEELTAPADVWLTRGDSILASHPVRAVQLTDEVRWRVGTGRFVLHSPDKPLAGRTCMRVGSNFRQWSRQSRISRALQAEWRGIAFKFPQAR